MRADKNISKRSLLSTQRTRKSTIWQDGKLSDNCSTPAKRHAKKQDHIPRSQSQVGSRDCHPASWLEVPLRGPARALSQKTKDFHRHRQQRVPTPAPLESFVQMGVTALDKGTCLRSSWILAYGQRTVSQGWRLWLWPRSRNPRAGEGSGEAQRRWTSRDGKERVRFWVADFFKKLENYGFLGKGMEPSPSGMESAKSLAPSPNHLLL